MTDSARSIRVRDVNKTFRIPLDRPATLKHRVTHPRSTSRYRPFEALRGISFDVAPGEFLGIIGHNGSGKSTLLKIMAGIYTADSGSVEMDGRVSPFLELGVGFNPELTARENVFLSGSVLGLTRSELDQRIDGIIDFADIGEFAEVKLKNFSSGMQVRLAFSVAIQADARILLMDEVLAVGDVAFQEKCFEVFAEYKRSGRTVVLVTHDLIAVHNYCDRVLMLDHGHLVADGQPSQVTAQYRRAMGVLHDAPVDPGDGEALTSSDRRGSRELMVTSLRLLDRDGRPHSTFYTDQPMTVEVGYVVNEPVDGFVCRLVFERGDGLPLATPSTATRGMIVPCPPRGSRGVLRYTVEALPFCHQSCTLGVELLDRHAGHAYDHVGGARTFQVVDERGRDGLLEPGGAWEVGASEAEGAESVEAARVGPPDAPAGERPEAAGPPG